MRVWMLIVWCVALLGLAPTLQAAVAPAPSFTNEALVSSTTVVWDTLDANGKGNGFITAKHGANGDWTWERYERQADGTHPKVDPETATLSSSDPIVYTWTSTETSHVGDARIDAECTTGEWEDKTAKTTTDIKKAS